ncbi:molecular chaperone [Pseudoalteromonas phenolica]|uniref:Molecular chaperone n=1 Tax=Pseudoalteromonas phenolica TaxID=161398 RepID=A0A5R9Q401_9GAMM|nr:molecular chaperone [Pseudoalteromonas phenolica]
MFRYLSALFIFLACLSSSFAASANILISPTRVAFEERQRAERLIVVNNSDKVQSYRLSWQERAALSEGGYRDLEGIHDKSLSSMVRMSPSQIRLAPGQKQIIKLSVRRTKTLAPGEYRSHLLLSALPLEQTSSGGKGINIDIQVNYSLPIILRVERETPVVSLTGLDLKRAEENDTLKISMAKQGKFSSFGRVEAFFTPSGKAEKQRIGIIENYSIHSELERALLPMTLLNGYRLSGTGKLTLKYSGQKEYQGEVFFEQQIDIN